MCLLYTRLALLFLSICVISLFSCTADVAFTMEGSVQGSISGSIQARLTFHPVFITYYRDAAFMVGDQFSPDFIEKQMEQYQFIDTVTVTRSPDWKMLNILIVTENFPKLVKEMNLPVDITAKDKVVQVSTHSNITFVSTQRFDFMDVFSLFLPSSQMNYRGYIENLNWALGEYASMQEVQEMVDAARLQLKIYAPEQNIVRLIGGKQVTQDTALFDISLAEVLEDEQQLIFTVGIQF